MSAPKRIQRRREKGWRMPPGAVCVTRPGLLGNPFTLAAAIEAGFLEPNAPPRERGSFLAGCFDHWLTDGLCGWWQGPESERRRAEVLARLPEIRGRDLACWCRLCELHRDGLPAGETCPDCEPCHADILLALANIDSMKEAA